MKRIPARPDLGHLKKQAKELLALYRSSDPGATARFRDALPAAAGKSDTAITALGLRLHDAQSCIAREYGFASWADLQGFVLARRAQADDPAKTVLHWLRCVYAGDIAGGAARSRPLVAVRLLDDSPGLLGDDPYLACAIGDEAALRRATAQDPGWVHRAGGPLQLPPLVAVTHSGLLKLPAYAERLRACARFLLDAGADANQSTGNRCRRHRSRPRPKPSACPRCTVPPARTTTLNSRNCCCRRAPIRTTTSRSTTRSKTWPASSCC